MRDKNGHARCICAVSMPRCMTAKDASCKLHAGPSKGHAAHRKEEKVIFNEQVTPAGLQAREAREALFTCSKPVACPRTWALAEGQPEDEE